VADRVALYLQDAHSIQDAIKYVQYAESRGFEAVWQAESRLVRDAIVPMAAFAATTTAASKSVPASSTTGRATPPSSRPPS
jgi:hypothetical protein